MVRRTSATCVRVSRETLQIIGKSHGSAIGRADRSQGCGLSTQSAQHPVRQHELLHRGCCGNFPDDRCVRRITSRSDIVAPLSPKRSAEPPPPSRTRRFSRRQIGADAFDCYDRQPGVLPDSPDQCRCFIGYEHCCVSSCGGLEIFSRNTLENSACQGRREALSLLPHLGARVLKTVTPSL